MNFKYNLSKKNYKKIIYENNSKTNLIYIILMALFYLIITAKLLLYNTLVVFIGYAIYMIIILLILFILNKIFTNVVVKLNEKNLNIKYGVYECKLDDDGINEQIDDFQYTIKFDDIRKIKSKKNALIIYLKNRSMALVFKKDLFEEKDAFDKLEKKLKEKGIINK